ncbi:uracil-DNA glycosylase [Kordiimonas aquimaris]|uniref:uracil-DNA glycosylase n=1 Tax=Kordiimonas aquimaris TaxID=707591 RepID=UPI0021CF05C1|nr:uracil-DNA glycosylase [Kordiimonas aquimaris]
MSAHAPDIEDPATLLAWQVAMGADEAIESDFVDRFSAVTSKPDNATASHSGSSVQQNSGNQIATNQSTGARVVTAKPVQSIDGHGAESAQTAANNADSLEELRTAMSSFDGGLLKRSAKNLVFADGVAGSSLMIVGEAPGADEDREGRPFVGVSGQLLDRMLNAAGLDRTKNVYISNILPWRPLGNRTPDTAVTEMCLPFIRRHIELANPKVILMLGGVSAKALLGTSDGITKLRGKWKPLTIGSTSFTALPAYHPAYLLRQPHLKGMAWRDLLAVKAKLSELDA